MRIRNRLLLLVVSVLLPAILAAGIGIAYVYDESRETNRRNLGETTRALALLLDKDIETREGVLHSLADSPALMAGDLKLFYEHARRTAAKQSAAIVLADPSGAILLNTAVPFGTTNIVNSGTLAELRREHGADGTIVSNLYLSPHRQSHAFALQVPVRVDDRIRYYVSMGSNVSQFQTLMHSQRFPESWMASILDRKGMIVAQTVEAGQYVGKPARPALLSQIRRDKEGFYEGPSETGEPSVASFSHAPRSEWTFVVDVPASELQSAALRTSIVMASVSVLLLTMALLGAFAVAHRTVRPIEALRRAAERLGRGDEVIPEISGISEMDEVSRAMARASADIRNAKAELEQRVDEAVATTERSQRALLQSQKLESLGRLTGGIAHDFNNVLQTISSGLQLSRMKSADEQIRSLLATCQQAVGRAVELTRQLMAFGRVQDARLETIDLSRQIRESIPLLKGSLPSNIDFRVTAADQLWPVKLDRLQLELALLNLSINARDAMPNGGILQLEVQNETDADPGGDLPRGDYVRITVSDSGTGMTNEVLARAVDPFFTTKAVGRGSGLGLPQAYGFARQSGGVLLLRSEAGRGTQAVLYLPRAAAAMSRPDGASLFSTSETSDLRQGGVGGAVLFVEDDPLVVAVVQPALLAAGLRVKAVPDGEEAMAVLQSGETIDYVFSDIVMPGRMSGIDLAGLIQVEFPSIRVVLATGYSDRRVSLPNVRVLAKPYDVPEVVIALTAP